jgi:hypothetical protein
MAYTWAGENWRYWDSFSRTDSHGVCAWGLLVPRLCPGTRGAVQEPTRSWRREQKQDLLLLSASPNFHHSRPGGSGTPRCFPVPACNWLDVAIPPRTIQFGSFTVLGPLQRREAEPQSDWAPVRNQQGESESPPLLTELVASAATTAWRGASRLMARSRRRRMPGCCNR